MSALSHAPAPLLVAPAELKSAAARSRVFLDATWVMPGSARKPHEEWAAKRIPGARFFDLDLVASDHPLGLKHMLPSPAVFASACAGLGISPSTHVVLYDTHGVFSAPRALRPFQAFGHVNSSVLNGGLPRWEDEGHPLETDTPVTSTTSDDAYAEPELDSNVVKSYEQMVSNALLDPASNDAASLVFDARSKGRYSGADPEPRPGLPSGHMPHSFSLPFQAFLESPKGSYTVFKSPDAIRAALLEAVQGNEETLQQILDGKRSVINSCGSGMTACILWLGLQLLGVKSAVYDESWTGYAMRKESKIVSGHAAV
ncbi:Rhodanese-like protein [Exidia glandulosa HHB12029]|uniref:Rhodanese-like protein n=1 Tax=Exidia glandulosa HHB12029 TaxID=1314781 RepID=A0A165PDL5_EXIGL|nr:Rhodanese-like protein [Exidia glandulosa HHB12029]